jgi:CrcB protein
MVQDGPAEQSARATPSPRDSHTELPLDPDAPRPLHLKPTAWAWVFAGGLIGTGLRWLIERALPTAPGDWPTATFVINIAGAFMLGTLLEVLALAGPDAGWRLRIRLFGGTGLCGAFTTYSTLALEVSLLGRHGAAVIGVAYGVCSVVAGIVAAWAGIVLAGRVARLRWGSAS